MGSVLQWKSVFDEQLLVAEFDRLNVNPVHVQQLWKYLLANKDVEAHNVPGLPLRASDMLCSKFKALTSHVQSQVDSIDGRTTKLLINLQNGQSVEAVIMRHDPTAGKYAGSSRLGNARGTLCVSSQVGCKMGCTFCATGTMSFKGNLSAGEIVEQLVHAFRISPIRNVVFMGMGEPMNNYAAVVQAVRSMTGRCFHLSPKHITVSTVGIIPRILSLKEDLPDVNLAVSLHAPTQELRCQIVPAAQAFPLSKIMGALDTYCNERKCRVFIEYVMLAGINDGQNHAHQLGKLLQYHNLVVNLIPYNPSNVLVRLKASEHITVFCFQKILREIYKLRTTIRQEMGQDIVGACGQLALIYPQKLLQHDETSQIILPDIEDMGLHTS
eukprot:c25955_g1_i1 orf=118-1266(+)